MYQKCIKSVPQKTPKYSLFRRIKNSSNLFNYFCCALKIAFYNDYNSGLQNGVCTKYQSKPKPKKKEG